VTVGLSAPLVVFVTCTSIGADPPPATGEPLGTVTVRPPAAPAVELPASDRRTAHVSAAKTLRRFVEMTRFNASPPEAGDQSGATARLGSTMRASMSTELGPAAVYAASGAVLCSIGW
jgi:hypothetical protein